MAPPRRVAMGRAAYLCPVQAQGRPRSVLRRRGAAPCSRPCSRRPSRSPPGRRTRAPPTRPCRRGSPARSPSRTSTTRARRASRVDLADRRRSSSRATRHARSRPPRPRSSRSASRLLSRLGPAYRIRRDVLGDGRRRGLDAARRPRPEGPRRSDALERRAAAARGAGAGARHPARHRRRRRRRVVLRRAPDRAGLEAVVLHRRVAAALGAHRRPRRYRGRVSEQPALAAALLVPRRARRGRDRGPGRRDRRRAAAEARARERRLAAARCSSCAP